MSEKKDTKVESYTPKRGDILFVYNAPKSGKKLAELQKELQELQKKHKLKVVFLPEKTTVSVCRQGDMVVRT